MKLTSFVCIGNTNGKHDKLSLPPGDVLIHTGGYTTCWVPAHIKTKKEAQLLQPEPPDDIIKWMSDQPFKTKLMVPAFRDVANLEDLTHYRAKFERAGIELGVLECMTIKGIGVGCYNYWHKHWRTPLPCPNNELLIDTTKTLRNDCLSSIGVPYGLDILITNPITVAESITYNTDLDANIQSHHDILFNLVPTIYLFSGAETGNNLPSKILDTTCYNTSVWYRGQQVPEVVQFYIAAGGAYGRN